MTKKIIIDKFGIADVLKIQSVVDQKDLEDSDVRIDVHYSGINFADIIMRQGLYQDAPKRPFTPGYEVSGIVLETGKKVTHVKKGDQVFAGTQFGGYSSIVTLDQRFVFKLPDHLTLEEGAAMPVAFITAHAALIDMARVRKGDHVLIDCATGGLGNICLQLLQAVGAHAVGLTSSSHKKVLIEQYGAKALTHEEFILDKDTFDVVIDSSGGSGIMKRFKRLKPTGAIICLGISSGITGSKRNLLSIIKTVLTMPKISVVKLFNHNKGIYALNALHIMQDAEYFERLRESFVDPVYSHLKPNIGKVFSYKEVANAHRSIEERKTTGKVLLSWK
ncbi:alcohol dehydrogenase catalytic domain-containing protein [Bacteriovoracaceae bacterium]|nr:alcohol dehydrogenase catalytic domain-containing protein [Bacteriovoracaceae bacterium]